jgi:hypothetical protein
VIKLIGVLPGFTYKSIPRAFGAGEDQSFPISGSADHPYQQFKARLQAGLRSYVK